MENKFDTYNASQIVPQMTLLQKFNKIIKYLHENVYVNVFPCYVGYFGESTPYNISNLNLDGRTLMTGDIVVFTNNYYAFVGSVSGEHFYVTHAQSFKGDKGDKGDTGDTGPQGVSVTLVQVNSQNHLILRLSNNTTVDAGVIYANKEKIELTGEFDENLEMIIDITQLQYNRLIQKDISLVITDTTTGYKFLFNKTGSDNVDVDEVYYTSSFATNNFTAIVEKVRDGEEQVIGYAVAISGFKLVTESDLSEKQDVLTFDNTPTENSDNPVKSGGVYSALGNKQNNLTPSSVNDGTINKVLGFDSSNNLVKGAVSGGGKVYMHKLDFAYPGGNYAHCVLYSASNTPFTLQTLNKFLNDNNINNMSSGIPFWTDVENSFSIVTDSFATPYITTVYRRLFGDVGTPALCYKSSKKEITIDTANNKIIFSAPSSSTQYLSVSSLIDTVIEI